jgi:hypothetical protein
VNGFGFVDLLQQTLREADPPRGRLEGCTCSRGEECLHTWTYRTSETSTVPYQDDYLFASPALAARLDECAALGFTPGWPSDHVPIVATFKGFEV